MKTYIKKKTNILIVGSGARESAFIWKLNQSKKDIKLFSINPNAGAAEFSTPIYTEKEDLELIKSIISYDQITEPKKKDKTDFIYVNVFFDKNKKIVVF